MSLPYGQPDVPEGFDAFGRWFERTFKIFTDHWQVWLLQGLAAWAVFGIMAIIIWLMGFGGFIIAMVATGSRSSPSPELTPALLALLPVVIILGLLSLIAGMYLWAGMFLTAMKAVHGDTIEFKDLFSAGWALPGLIGLSILEGLILIIPYLLCFIPGLVLSIFFMLAVPLYLSRSLGAAESLGESFSIVKRNFWLFLVFSLVMGLLIGAINQTGIGTVIGLPLTAIYPAVIITEIFHWSTGGLPPPPREPGL